jgi:hypothetical protein
MPQQCQTLRTPVPGPTDRPTGSFRERGFALAGISQPFHRDVMWNQPYLETCCRAALHRLYLSGPSGRPAGISDDPCLRRLAQAGLCRQDNDGRVSLTPEGTGRHAAEVLKTAAVPIAPDFVAGIASIRTAVR